MSRMKTLFCVRDTIPYFLLCLGAGLALAQTHAAPFTDNVTDRTPSSFDFTLDVPSEGFGDGIDKVVLVIRKDLQPVWIPENGEDYSGHYMADAEHEILVFSASDGQTLPLTLAERDMGSGYYVKAWYQYDDTTGPGASGLTDLYAANSPYQSPAYASKLANLQERRTQLEAELQSAEDLLNSDDASLTQAVYEAFVNDAKDTAHDFIENGLKDKLVEIAKEQVLRGAAAKFHELVNSIDDEALRTKVENAAAGAIGTYQVGQTALEIKEQVDALLASDNIALELGQGAVVVVAPYAEPIFYITETIIETNIDVAGIRAEAQAWKNGLEQTEIRLLAEIDELFENEPAETYDAFCVTELGGTLSQPLELIERHAPYALTENLVIEPVPATPGVEASLTNSPAEVFGIEVDADVSITVEANGRVELEKFEVVAADSTQPWGQFYFRPGASGSMDDVLVQGGGAGPAHRVMLDIATASVTLDDCRIRESHNHGMRLANVDAGGPDLTFCVIEENHGSGLILPTGLGASFQLNQISANGQDGRALAADLHLVGTAGTPDPDATMAGLLSDNAEIGTILIAGGATPARIESDFTYSINSFYESLRIAGEVIVGGEATLTLDRVNLLLFPNALLRVDGTLLASQTGFNPALPAAGWGSLVLEAGASATISQCTFQLGGRPQDAIGIAAPLVVRSNDVSIDQSRFSNNRGSGLFIEGVSPDVTNSFFLNNTLDGITVTTSSPILRGLSLTGNGNAGMRAIGGANPDATQNWWGNVSGPTSELNENGTGDAAPGITHFDPWIGSDSDDAPPDPDDSSIGAGAFAQTRTWSTSFAPDEIIVGFGFGGANPGVTIPFEEVPNVLLLQSQVREPSLNQSGDKRPVGFTDGELTNGRLSGGGFPVDSVQIPAGDFIPGKRIYVELWSYNFYWDEDAERYRYQFSSSPIKEGYFVAPLIGDVDQAHLTAGTPVHFLYDTRVTGTLKIDPGVVLKPVNTPRLTVAVNGSLEGNDFLIADSSDAINGGDYSEWVGDHRMGPFDFDGNVDLRDITVKNGGILSLNGNVTFRGSDWEIDHFIASPSAQLSLRENTFTIATSGFETIAEFNIDSAEEPATKSVRDNRFEGNGQVELGDARNLIFEDNWIESNFTYHGTINEVPDGFFTNDAAWYRVPTGEISGDHDFTLSASVRQTERGRALDFDDGFNLSGLVTVPAGNSLTIGPGFTVAVGGFDISGHLDIAGCDVGETEFSWGGFVFRPGSSGRIHDCEIDGVNAGEGDRDYLIEGFEKNTIYIASGNAEVSVTDSQIVYLSGSNGLAAINIDHPSRPEIRNNLLQGYRYGILLTTDVTTIFDEALSSPVELRQNRFLNGTIDAVWGTFDARYNDWGSPTGPRPYDGSNPNGEGERVDGTHLVYRPWLADFDLAAFNAWLEENAPEGVIDTSLTAEALNNGLSNQMSFAFNVSANTQSGSGSQNSTRKNLPEVEPDEAGFVLEFTRNQDATAIFDFVLNASSDLTDWNPPASESILGTEITDNGDGTETVKVTLDQASEENFLRVDLVPKTAE